MKKEEHFKNFDFESHQREWIQGLTTDSNTAEFHQKQQQELKYNFDEHISFFETVRKLRTHQEQDSKRSRKLVIDLTAKVQEGLSTFDLPKQRLVNTDDYSPCKKLAFKVRELLLMREDINKRVGYRGSYESAKQQLALLKIEIDKKLDTILPPALTTEQKSLF